MNALFIILLLVSIVVLIVGLTNPAIIKLSSRKKVGVICGSAIIAFFILAGITTPNTTVPVTETYVAQAVVPTPVVAKTSATENVPPIVSKPVPPPPTVQTPQPTTVLCISGSGTKSTQMFTVGDNWTLNWNYDCSNFGEQGNFQVSAYDSGNSSEEDAINPVNELGKSGSDTEYYHQAGTYYLQVNSECNWSLTAKS